jgi:asparagine synthase (glutamine-hydrolysing)
MCGIAGFIDLSRSRSSEENDRLAAAMGDCIRHRGPDAGAFWSNAEAGVWLAHRRLSIVDLTEAGAQPMSTPDGRAHIVYNGEAYNAADLRPELEAAGYRFRGHSDTEVLLYGCQHWGVERTVSRLIGFFAFAYWDDAERTLTLVRDRIGKKPLYFANTPNSFLFASELRPLMLHPDCPRDIDRSSVAGLMRTHYIAAPFSIFSGVEKLQPGEMITFRADRRELKRKHYWNLLDEAERGSSEPWTGSAQDAVDAAEALISDATRIRLVSDVPLGALLSGGIDSSTVVAMMCRHATGRVRTFSIGYSEGDYDEAQHARAVATRLGTEHTGLTVEPKDALAVIPSLPNMFDEPFGDMSQIPTYLVSRLAREHVSVALGGDGGDEVFAGYNRHVAAAGLLRRLGVVPQPARLGLAALMRSLPPDRWQSLLSTLPASARPRAVGEKIHKLARLLSGSVQDQYLSLVSNWADPGEVVEGAERLGALEDPALRGRFPDAVAYMRYLDLATWLPGDILTKVDRASMATSLEVRAPLLDHRLVEFSFRIPSSLHLREGQSKWLLRKVLERSVPRELFDRPKMGFGIPMDQWLRGPLREWAEELLARDRLIATAILRPEPIRSLWERHLSGRINGQYQLWPVLMLQAWLERWQGAGGKQRGLPAAA